MNLVRPVVAAGMVFGLVHTPAQAQEQEQGSLPPVDLVVTVGFAESTQGNIAPEFRQIHRSVPRFGAIRVLNKQPFTLSFGETGQIKLPSGKHAKVMPLSVHARELFLHFWMADKVDTRMRLQNHQRMTIGPIRHENGHLIIHVEPDFTAYLPIPDPEGPETQTATDRR